MSNPLLIDLYQLTMAQGYFLEGKQDYQASFAYSFREHPFKGGFAVFAGVEATVQYLQNWGFGEKDVAWLGTLKANDATPLFKQDFLDYLLTLDFDLDIAAAPEGSIVFAGEPLVRVTGSLIVAQMLETALMNRLNFETLIATKAARCCIAAQGDRVLEFGLRRAQGPDGGISASRAAYIGGCSATSNMEAARACNIPVSGTIAHSWVMAHDSEQEAFEAWTRSSANNSVLLVDTYDSMKGIAEAVKAAVELNKKGGNFLGIRLDSGDLAWLSKRAREALDAAGLQDAKIFASNDLDEYTIMSLKSQGAVIDSWGVGTSLSTGGEQAALGGVYKMTALKKPGKDWEPKIKVSDQAVKTSTQGLLAVRRFFNDRGRPTGDMVYDLLDPPPTETIATIIDPFDMTRQKSFDPDLHHFELLQPLFVGGKLVAQPRDATTIRDNVIENIKHLDRSHQRFMQPHRYPVGLERSLFNRRLDLIERSKNLK